MASWILVYLTDYSDTNSKPTNATVASDVVIVAGFC